jgi:hypothetical protein
VIRVIMPARRPVKVAPSSFYAYQRCEDRSVLERIGPHQVARQQTATGLRCLPSLRHDERGAR